jgi:predicted PurR-regulated permease PerM
MNSKERVILWIVILVAFGLFLSQIHTILFPFVVAGITAYFLDPAVDRLERYGMTRPSATITIIGIFFAAVTIAVILVSPILYNQIVEFTQKIPEYTHYIESTLIPRASKFMNYSNMGTASEIHDSLKSVSGTALQFVGGMLSRLWQSGLAVINIFALIFITPVVTFYILRDWHVIIAKVDSLIPLNQLDDIRTQFRLIDKALSGYIRGQLNVCLILGTFYAIGLTMVNLQFGFFIGFATGILAFIPFVGIAVGSLVGIIIAFFQFDNLIDVAMVACVFVLGQVIEGNFITPKLVGDKVGLSPVWLIFGMLAGGALFGFTGVLLAVPATAIIGVLARFFVSKYKQSMLYLGKEPTIVLERPGGA